MRHLLSAFILIFITSFISRSTAQLRLPAVISSGMVLQQKDSATLWGWAGPGSKVYITTSWNNSKDSTTTSNGATWKKKIATPAAGGPFNITIVNGRDSLQLSDVMAGEVWVCSGQSNMEWSYNHGEKDIPAELANAKNTNIRFFQVPKTTSPYPQDDVKAKWVTCDSNTIKSFSAVGYFFGKKISQALNVPVGLINSSWGGTPAEVWTPADLIEKDTALQSAAARLNTTATGWPAKQGLVYNAMIAPLTNFNIAGAIWYQGESNVGTNATYEKLFTTMIDSWRQAWEKDFPFYYVQIAPYRYGSDTGINGALLREAQAKAMRHPRTGMVVIADLVDSVTNIHPSHKREVGNRLANWALSENYGQGNIVYKNPVFEKAEKKPGKIELSFTNVPTGFKSKDRKISGFMISDNNGQWYPAEAKISGNKITVSNKQVKNPVNIRYGFTNTLIGNVFSAEGLPLTPFRTDQM
jgi:sialate O-acetylesterase